MTIYPTQDDAVKAALERKARYCVWRVTTNGLSDYRLTPIFDDNVTKQPDGIYYQAAQVAHTYPTKNGWVAFVGREKREV